MTIIRVRANAAIDGYRFGDEYDVELTPRVEAMIDAALLVPVGDQDLG